MGKIKKSTKKFMREQLPQTIRKRKELQKKAKPFQGKEPRRSTSEAEDGSENKPSTGKRKSSLDFESMDADAFFKMDFGTTNADNLEEEESLKKELEKDSKSVPKMKQKSKNEKPKKAEKGKTKGKGKKASQKDENDEDEDEDYPTMDEYKRELRELQETQPDFFDYIQENDPNILDILDEEEAEDDEDEGEDEEPKKGKKKKPSDFDDDDDFDEDQFDDDGFDYEQPKKKGPTRRYEYGSPLTWSILNDILQRAVEEKSLAGLQELLSAFRSGCHLGDDVEGVVYPFHIEDGKIYQRLMIACFENVDALFNHHFKWDPSLGHQENKRLLKASRPLKKMILSYFGNLVHFLRKKPDPRLFSYVLHQTDRMMDYFILLPKLARKFFKILLVIWSRGEKNSRLDAFLNIRKMCMAMPFPFIELALKGIYLTFVRNAKFTNSVNYSSIIFMMNCVTEIYGLEFSSSYQHMFAYIRQMAIHLRNCLIKKSKESFSLIYNWQYVNCICLWGQVLATYQDQKEIRQLIYPFSQIVLGTLRLIPTAKFFPMRFIFSKVLNNLSRRTNVYIPVGSVLIEVIQNENFTAKKRFTNTKAKPIDMKCHFKVPESLLSSPQYWEGCAHEVLLLLTDFLSFHSYSIGFPELAFPLCVHIKKTLKNCSSPLMRRGLKTLLDKINSNITLVMKKREGANFSPKDTDAVDGFAVQLRKEGESPLDKYLKDLSADDKRRQTILKAQFEDVNDAAMNESNFESEKKTKGKRENGEDGDEEDGDDEDEFDGGEDDDEDDDDDDDDDDDGDSEDEEEEEEEEEEERPQKTSQKAKPQPGGKAKPTKSRGKDIVKDFDLSAFD